MNRPNAQIIRGARVLHGDGDAPYKDVLVVDNRIDELLEPGMAAPHDAVPVAAEDRLLIPGLVNAHTHGHGALSRGSGDLWTLELLLNAARTVTGESSTELKYLTVLMGALEMVSKGCTGAYDLFVEFPLPTREGLQAAGKAYLDAGMRAVVAPQMSDRSFYQAIPGLMDAIPTHLHGDIEKARMHPAEAHLAVCRDTLANWSLPQDRVRMALAPTIALHCSDDFIRGCRQLADEYGVGLQMHLAESKVQAVAGLATYGKTLTAHLDELGFLGPTFTAAHGVWLDDDDIRRLADRGAGVAHNPGSNLRLGSGIAAVRELRDAGVRVGVGTDGAQCSDHQNMFEAMRLAAYVSRVRSHDPSQWISAPEAFAMATRDSASTLGFGDEVGLIAPGMKADMVFLDLGHIHWIPMNDPINQLVNTEDGSAVDGVMVDGRIIYWQRQHLSVDVANLRARVESAVEMMRPKLAAHTELCHALEQHIGSYCIGLARSDYHVHRMAGNDH